MVWENYENSTYKIVELIVGTTTMDANFGKYITLVLNEVRVM